MNVRTIESSEIEPARLFLCANGWAQRVGDAEHFRKLIEASQRTAVAVDADGDIVGFARAITDGFSNGYLSMVAVAPAHRRQGLGRRLVEHVMGDSPDVTWVLRAGRDGAVGFFGALGFSVSTVAMEKLRREPGS